MQWLVPLFLASQLSVGCGGGGGGSGSDSGSESDASAASASTATSPTGAAAPLEGIGDVSASRYALWSDELGSATLTVEARETAGNIPEISYFDGLPGGTGALLTQDMFDDGSHGDRLAGDGTWTATFVLGLAEPTALRLYGGLADVVQMTVRSAQRERSLEIGVVSRTLEGTVQSASLTSDVYVTDSLVNIVAPTFDGTSPGTITERLYGAYPNDPFDFVVVFHSRPTGDGVPRSLGVRNAIDGINLGTYDSSAAYGSAGRLQQVVFQNASIMGREVNHEIGHRWGAFLDDPALNLSLPTGFHWGASTHVGQMGNGPYLLGEGGGGYKVTNANGSEQFVSNDFSPLELYLMGLADPSEVSGLRFVTDPDVDVEFGATVAAGDTRWVEMDDIIAVYGERQPSAATSPKDFTAAFVVVSDEPLAEAEYTLSTHIARYVAGTSRGGVRTDGLFEMLDPSSFAAAADFRATLATRLP